LWRMGPTFFKCFLFKLCYRADRLPVKIGASDSGFHGGPGAECTDKYNGRRWDGPRGARHGTARRGAMGLDSERLLCFRRSSNFPVRLTVKSRSATNVLTAAGRVHCTPRLQRLPTLKSRYLASQRRPPCPATR